MRYDGAGENLMVEKASAQDVAALAGVSRSAVSRVYTPGASVSEKTAEKVRKAAAKLGYRPNAVARSLITGRTRMIGLVVAYLENYFYPDALEKLSNALQQRGYHVLVFMASQTAGNIDEVLDEILDYQVDGIIAASVALSSDLATRCRAHGVPVVLFNRSQDIEGVASVTSDNVGGGVELARFLVAGGHKKIGYIAGWEGASTQRDREAGFRKGLADAGLSLHAREVGDFHAERARDAARNMFKGPDHPDAVFVANDHMAILVMDVLRFELGLSVPGDVSIVGYDDVPPAAWLGYSLTTIRQHTDLMVERTVDVLLAELDQDDAAAGPNVIPGPLIIRKSARIPEQWP